jgi:hypothetical protein
VQLARRKLDRQIRSGSDLDASPAVALRARQLIDPRTRRCFARHLRGAVGYVDRVGSRPLFTAVVIDRAMVRAGREAILGLAERLEGPEPVCPVGVVLTLALLTDGLTSPIYNRDCGRSVEDAIWEIADALGVDATATKSDAFAS